MNSNVRDFCLSIQMCVIFAVFNDFVNNEGAMNLVRQYLNKEIKTLNDLHTSLWNSGIKLSPLGLILFF